NWFATGGVEPRYAYTYGRQNWFPCAAAEHRAVREGVGLFDQSSLAKVLLQGPDVTVALQRLCANDVDVTPGRIVYTQMLNERGGIDGDLTVTRLADEPALVAAGADLALRHAGYHAMDSLRMEKGYRSWGHDIGSEDTPLEAGLSFAVAFKKDGFAGRDALLRHRDTSLARRLVMFTLADPQPLLLGDEPIYRDGVLVGRITSGAYGHTLGRPVGMGFVAPAD